MNKTKEKIVSNKCPSFGSKDIHPWSGTYRLCEFKNVCKFKGYCVVHKSMKIDEMNRRFSRRQGWTTEDRGKD